MISTPEAKVLYPTLPYSCSLSLTPPTDIVVALERSKQELILGRYVVYHIYRKPELFIHRRT